MSVVSVVFSVVALVLGGLLFVRVLSGGLREFLLSLSLLKRRVARMYSPSHPELDSALQVSIQDVTFSDPDSGGECHGRVRVLVTNEAVASLERLCVNVRVDSDQCGSFHTAREYYDVKLTTGESAVIEMDIGLVSRAMMRDGYEMHVQVVGARTVTHEMPTYVLPEMCGREVSIREGFPIATDVLVERVTLSVKKGILRSKGEVSIAYLVRNHGQAFHQGISLVTRLMENKGSDVARSRSRFDVIPWGERKVVVKFPLENVSGISAAQFAAAFTGLEDFIVGSAYFTALTAVTEQERNQPEEWQGEEINPHAWDEQR